jgi:flagellar assembly protein FliH
MISPSESAGAKGSGRGAAVGTSVRLLGEGVREVSRLEFFPLERDEAIAEVEAERVEVLPMEEVAPVGQLSSQAEEMFIGIERARIEAKVEARRELDEELERRIAAERSSMLKAGEEFRRERARYFSGVEAEVVKLALAIAARVLHREAKLDPLLLAGVVRVALEKIEEGSAAVLRVPVNEVETWRGLFTDGPESSLQLVADERLGAGECVLDTNVGKVELGVSAQLQEIERGFFDLMQQRPA